MDHLSCSLAKHFPRILDALFFSFSIVDPIVPPTTVATSDSSTNTPRARVVSFSNITASVSSSSAGGVSSHPTMLLLQHIRVLRSSLQLSIKLSPDTLQLVLNQVLLPRLRSITCCTTKHVSQGPAAAGSADIESVNTTSITDSQSSATASAASAVAFSALSRTSTLPSLVMSSVRTDARPQTSLSPSVRVEYQLQLCRFVAVGLMRLQADANLPIHALDLFWHLTRPNPFNGSPSLSSSDLSVAIPFSLDWQHMDATQMSTARNLLSRCWEVMDTHISVV
jgi:hypothetical protein